MHISCFHILYLQCGMTELSEPHSRFSLLCVLILLLPATLLLAYLPAEAVLSSTLVAFGVSEQSNDLHIIYMQPWNHKK
jgi:hypothetical protein